MEKTVTAHWGPTNVCCKPFLLSPVRPVDVLLFSSSPLEDWTITPYSWPGCSQSNVTSFWCLRTSWTASSRLSLYRKTEYPSTSPGPGVQLTFRWLLSPLTWMFFTLLGTNRTEALELKAMQGFSWLHCNIFLWLCLNFTCSTLYELGPLIWTAEGWN